MCVVFTAYPNSPEAAVSDGGGAGGVSIGSQAVHGLCSRTDRMLTVSSHSFSILSDLLHLICVLCFIPLQHQEKVITYSDLLQPQAVYFLGILIGQHEVAHNHEEGGKW